MDDETRAAFDAAIAAGERAHLLTIGNDQLALRICRGNLDREGRWHPWRPDVFVIWRGFRRDARELRERFHEGAWSWLAWHIPRPLAYFATIRVGVHATTGEYGETVVPEMPFIYALQRWDGT